MERKRGARAATKDVESRGSGKAAGDGVLGQGAKERRALRSRYLAVKNIINDEREFIGERDSDKFTTIITEVDNLHELVQKPREQVADAEALLDITNTLVTSVRSHGKDGLTPLDFVNSLISKFGHKNGGADVESDGYSLSWKDVGLFVSKDLRKVAGCCTMIGPMNNELKQRKIVVRSKRTKPLVSNLPEELHNTEEGKSETDKNMLTMFNILRKKNRVRLENLVLNRLSFAQTVENIFALSFLVKDGRAEISVNSRGHHLVAPKNAPPASAVTSGDATYRHFVFRFDFKDWELIRDMDELGEELMPHREASNSVSSSTAFTSAASSATTPIRKLTRNCGLVIQEQSVIDDDTEQKPSSGAASPRRTRRRF